jgi:two-component sensor histidine kinase
MITKFKKLPIPFKYVLLIALGVIVVFVAKDYIYWLTWKKYKVFDWVQAISIPFVNYVLWAFLSPIVYNLMLLFPLRKGFTIKMVSFHLLFSLILAFIHEFVSNLMYISIYMVFYPVENIEKFLMMRMNTIPYALLDRMIEYWIILGIFMALYYFNQFKDKEVEVVMMENELNNAQLSALKMQLQPHFLFNTLNTVSALISTNAKDAQKVLARLGNLLRTLLDQNQKNYIQLSEEIQYTRNYLDIEQTRFMDRLTVNYDIDPTALKAVVPNLILQPLVENAIKHGFSNRPEGGIINLSAKIDNNLLILEVEDDGIGCDNCDDLTTSSGIGLTNTRDRLKNIYKENATFKLFSRKGEGFKVQIIIPLNYVFKQ